MFGCEAEFCLHRNKHGQKGAIEFFSDINRYTSLELPYVAKGGRLAKPSLEWARTLFDHNEHFIELSNMGEEDRSVKFMLMAYFSLRCFFL